MITNDKLSQLSESLPENFDFYSLGQVSRASHIVTRETLTDVIAGKSGVSFRLLGEPAALLIVLFDSTLDVSMYTEMGNILASKLCQKLSEQGEGDLMITPPLSLEPRQLSKLLLADFSFIHQSYEHVNEGKRVVIDTLLMPEERIGNA